MRSVKEYDVTQWPQPWRAFRLTQASSITSFDRQCSSCQRVRREVQAVARELDIHLKRKVPNERPADRCLARMTGGRVNDQSRKGTRDRGRLFPELFILSSCALQVRFDEGAHWCLRGPTSCVSKACSHCAGNCFLPGCIDNTL